jgi:hypothetical protein
MLFPGKGEEAVEVVRALSLNKRLADHDKCPACDGDAKHNGHANGCPLQAAHHWMEAYG